MNINAADAKQPAEVSAAFYKRINVPVAARLRPCRSQRPFRSELKQDAAGTIFMADALASVHDRRMLPENDYRQSGASLLPV